MQRNWLERYYTFARLEGNGRSYELLGFRAVYLLLTNIFDEPLLPDCSTLQQVELPNPLPVDRMSLQHIAQATRYHEMVNLIYSSATLPLVLLVLFYWHFWLCLYGTLLFMVHLLCAIQERYKRALCLLALHHAPDRIESLPKAQRISQKQMTCVDRLVEQWFTPFSFETLRLYRRLRVEWFRQRILKVANQTFLDADQRHRGEKNHFIGGTTSAHLFAYSQQTRVSEMIHLVGILLHLPFLWYFYQERIFSASAYVLMLNGGNMWCALLQRYHRIRIASLLKRYSKNVVRA